MQQDDDLRPYKFIGLPLIPFMFLLALAGLGLTLLLHHFFPFLT